MTKDAISLFPVPCLPGVVYHPGPFQECIEQCTAECAAESSELSACQAEVERLKKCLQDAEQTVIRQQDKVVQADKKLDAMKAQRTAYVSVIQVCGPPWLPPAF